MFKSILPWLSLPYTNDDICNVQINDISNASQRMGYSRPAVFWEPKDKLFRAGVRLQFRYINPHFFKYGGMLPSDFQKDILQTQVSFHA